MRNESVVELISDLTAKLAAVAEGFNERIAQETREVSAGEQPSDAMLVKRARLVLDERRMRRQFLPDELFHEPAWDMLLALFVSRDEGQPMNVKTLVGMSDTPVTTSQRWIEHLHKLGLINRVIDSVDRRRVEISLSSNGDRALKAYLRALEQS